MYHHRLFGPALQQWDNHRVIPVLAKFFSITFMTMSMSWLVLFSTIENWLKVMAGVLMLLTAIYVLGKPSEPPEQRD